MTMIINAHPVMRLTKKLMAQALTEMEESDKFPHIADGVRLTLEFAGTSKKFVKIAKMKELTDAE